MAIENDVLTMSFIASEDLSDYQYHFVCQDSNGYVGLPDAATEYPLGILQNAPEKDEVATVMLMGVSKLVANAALAVQKLVKMEYVSTSDNGKADEADTEGDIVRGVVVFASGAEDDLCSVLLISHKLSFDVEPSGT